MTTDRRERQMLAFRRNSILGQLRWTQATLGNFLRNDTKLLSIHDKVRIQWALDEVNDILKTWDKHYIKNKKDKEPESV